MQAGSLPLTLAAGWKNVPPRPTGRRLVWKQGNRWWLSDTDFADPVSIGAASPVDCPVAYDPTREQLYRYHCAQWGDRRDASEFRRVSTVGGDDERLFGLGLNKWALWLCQYVSEIDSLAALIATEMPSKNDGTVVIQHQLGLYDLKQNRSLLVNLPRDCFYPLAMHCGSQQVLFHGAEGFQVVDFSGRRIMRLGLKGLPEGRGGCFNPLNPEEIVLGGGSLMLVRRKSEFIQLRERGLNPVWAPDGQQLYFAESSSDLWRRTADGQCERLLAVAGNRYAEVSRARPPRLTADGRYLALPLTRRIRRQPMEGAYGGDDSPAWVEWQAVCVLDLQAQEVWQAPGGGPVIWLS